MCDSRVGINIKGTSCTSRRIFENCEVTSD